MLYKCFVFTGKMTTLSSSHFIGRQHSDHPGIGCFFYRITHAHIVFSDKEVSSGRRSMLPGLDKRVCYLVMERLPDDVSGQMLHHQGASETNTKKRRSVWNQTEYFRKRESRRVSVTPRRLKRLKTFLSHPPTHARINYYYFLIRKICICIFR